MSETRKVKRGNRKPAKAGNKITTAEKKSETSEANDMKPLSVADEKPLAARTKKRAVSSNKKTEKNKDDGPAGKQRLPLSWIAIAFVALGAAMLVYVSVTKFNQTVISQPKTENIKTKKITSIGGPFSLVDQEGNSVTDVDFRGQYLLIYFGYTYCPDVCPTSLTNISDALERLGDEAAKITPILITIDPIRDTPAHLKEYASYFHPRLRALTGTPDQISQVAKTYRVYFNKAQQEDPNPEDYLMDHSSAIYLMGPDGTFRSHFSHSTDVEIMVKRIQDILS